MKAEEARQIAEKVLNDRAGSRLKDVLSWIKDQAEDGYRQLTVSKDEIDTLVIARLKELEYKVNGNDDDKEYVIIW